MAAVTPSKRLVKKRPLRADTDPWGIVRRYRATTGEWKTTRDETFRELRAAMGAPHDPPDASAPIHWAPQGTRSKLPKGAVLILEEGGELAGVSRLPPDVPLGYHTLRDSEGSTKPWIVYPKSCHLPDDLQAWGWIAQLYALRSRDSWGIGDLRDLREFGDWSRRSLGSGFVLVNPLAAAAPLLPQEASPYSPVSRRFLNPLFLRVEDVPGASESGVSLERLARAGRALNRDRLIDRDRIFHLKMEALERIWKKVRSTRADRKISGVSEESLRRFAAYCALAERHGGDWREWPAPFRAPSSTAVAAFIESHEDRVRFHEWLQWLLARQLEEAADRIPVIHDLPIGFTPGGADAWVWQDLLAEGVSVGAPPDSFNPAGQDWGLPPFIPARLRNAAYQPIRETLQAVLRRGAALRIDHVMGLFRLFWIPAQLGPAGGAYVRYPSDELLAMVALESRRAQSVIIGEDLGTVELGVRSTLRRRRILSYRVLWFEKGSPDRYPKESLATVTTHDLPTVAGLWTGSDFKSQQEAGLKPVEAEFERARNHLRQVAELKGSATAGEAAARVHEKLAAAPSRLVAATLEDALAVEERPNMPGTVSEWPNWSRALPLTLEELKTAPLLKRVARDFRKRRGRRALRPARRVSSNPGTNSQ